MAEQTAATVSPHLLTLLQRPSLCVGEDHQQFQQLRGLILDEIHPTTITECILAFDVVAAEWELLRLQRFKAGMINWQAAALLKKDGYTDADEVPKLLVLFRKSLAGDGSARNALDKLLQAYNHSTNDLVAYAFERTIDAQAQTDCMVNSAFRRREAAYAELARRRSNRRNQPGGSEAKQIEVAAIDGNTTSIVPAEPSPAG